MSDLIAAPVITPETIQKQLDGLEALSNLLKKEESEVVEVSPLWGEDIASVDPLMAQLAVSVVQWLDRASTRMLAANLLPQDGKSSSEIYEDISKRMHELSQEAMEAPEVLTKEKVGFWEKSQFLREKEVIPEVKLSLSARIAQLNSDKKAWFSQAEDRVRMLRSSLTIRDQVDESAAFTIDALDVFQQSVMDETDKIQEAIAQQEGATSFTATQRLSRRLRQLERAKEAGQSVQQRLANELTVGSASIEILDSALHNEQGLLSKVSMTFAEHELGLASLQVATQSKKAIAASGVAEQKVRLSTDESIHALAKTVSENGVSNAQFSDVQNRVELKKEKKGWLGLNLTSFFSKPEKTLFGLDTEQLGMKGNQDDAIVVPELWTESSKKQRDPELPFLSKSVENFVSDKWLASVNWGAREARNSLMNTERLDPSSKDVFAKGLATAPLNQYVNVSNSGTQLMLDFCITKIVNYKDKAGVNSTAEFTNILGPRLNAVSPELWFKSESFDKIFKKVLDDGMSDYYFSDDKITLPKGWRKEIFRRVSDHLNLSTTCRFLWKGHPEWFEGLSIPQLLNNALLREDEGLLQRTSQKLEDIFNGGYKYHEKPTILPAVRWVLDQPALSNTARMAAVMACVNIFKEHGKDVSVLPNWNDIAPIEIGKQLMGNVLKSQVNSQCEPLAEWLTEGLAILSHPKQEEWTNLLYQVQYCSENEGTPLPYEAYTNLVDVLRADDGFMFALTNKIAIELPQNGPMQSNPLSDWVTAVLGRRQVDQGFMDKLNGFSNWFTVPDSTGLLPSDAILSVACGKSKEASTVFEAVFKNSNPHIPMEQKAVSLAALIKKMRMPELLEAHLLVKHLPLDVFAWQNIEKDELILQVLEQGYRGEHALFGVVKMLEKNDLSFMDEKLLQRIWHLANPKEENRKYVGSGLKALAIGQNIALDLPELTEATQVAVFNEEEMLNSAKEKEIRVREKSKMRKTFLRY